MKAPWMRKQGKTARPAATVKVNALDRLIGHGLPDGTMRPQDGLFLWALGEWDGAVWRAVEIMEQRKSGRNRGKDIEVVLRANQGWDVWRAAAEIWLWMQKGCNNGVSVFFEDEGDVPVHTFFGMVRSNGRKT